MCKLAVLVCVGWAICNSVAHAEQTIVFNSHTVSVLNKNDTDNCSNNCAAIGGSRAKYLITQGWNIVSSTPKTVVNPYGLFANEGHKCTCIGTEYVLQKDEIPKSAVDQTDLLKKENELLKKEVDLLKSEINDLKKKKKPSK